MLGSCVLIANDTLPFCAPTRVKEIALTSSATASINTNASPLIRSKFLLDFFALISLLRYAGKPGGIAIVCAILGIMRPKDIAINIIYKILQPNVKLFCVMTRHFARPVFAVTLSKHHILVILRATHSMSLRGIDHCSIPYEVLCHCERSVAISRKGTLFIKPTQDTFVLAWRKGANKQKSEHYCLQ